MKTKLRLYITCFLLLSFQQVLCQKHFLPGYIISHDNDTTYGLIDYRGDVRNSKFCVFKSERKSEPVTYEPTQIKAYRFIDGRYFVSKTVQLKDKQILAFAEYLVDGIADLYCYRDIDGDHYYIKQDSGEMFELTNEEKRIYIEDHGYYFQKSNRYIGLLKYAFADCMEIQSDVSEAELTHKSLIKITKEYHNYICKDEECIVYQKRLPPVRIELAPYIGMSLSNLTFNWHDLYRTFDFNNSYFPVTGIILNTSLPRLNEKLSFRINADFGRYCFSAFRTVDNGIYILSDDIYVRSAYLRFSGSIKYTYPKGRFRPIAYIGVGLQNNMILDSRRIHDVDTRATLTSFLYDDVPMAKILAGALIGTGCNYYWNERRFVFFNIEYGYFHGNGSFAQTVLYSFFIRSGICFRFDL